MSTDPNQAPLLSTRGSGYHVIEHVNSTTSRRRGLIVRKNGGITPHSTYQLIRGGDLQPHRMFTSEQLRSARSRHFPHVGKKQLAKAAIRNHVSA